jgi:hypothetical protein
VITKIGGWGGGGLACSQVVADQRA